MDSGSFDLHQKRNSQDSRSIAGKRFNVLTTTKMLLKNYQSITNKQNQRQKIQPQLSLRKTCGEEKSFCLMCTPIKLC